MTILITGGAGFIGSHIADALISQGHEVILYDNLTPQVHMTLPKYLNPKAKLVIGDVRNEKLLKTALADAEIVIHNAAAVGISQSNYEISSFVSVNTAGTATLLDLLISKENQVKKLIVPGSNTSYGEGMYQCNECDHTFHPHIRSQDKIKNKQWEFFCPECNNQSHPIPTPETTDLHCNSIYAMTKRDQEQMALFVGKTYGIDTTVLRYFNVYGPRQSLSNPYTGVAAIFTSRVKAGNAPVVYEDGLQTRDFISVHDVVKANLIAIQNPATDGEIFNVGSGVATPISSVAQTIAKLYNRPISPLISQSYRKGDIRHCTADIAKIKSFGFNSTISFENGMKELVYWSTNEESIDSFEKAQEELTKRKLA